MRKRLWSIRGDLMTTDGCTLACDVQLEVEEVTRGKRVVGHVIKADAKPQERSRSTINPDLIAELIGSRVYFTAPTEGLLSKLVIERPRRAKRILDVSSANATNTGADP